MNTRATIEKWGESAMLQGLSRLSMVAVLPLLGLLGGGALYLYNSDLTSVRQDIVAVTEDRLDNTIAINELRLNFAVMQSAQNSDRLVNERWQTNTGAKLDRMADSLTTLTSTMAGLAATMTGMQREADRTRATGTGN